MRIKLFTFANALVSGSHRRNSFCFSLSLILGWSLAGVVNIGWGGDPFVEFSPPIPTTQSVVSIARPVLEPATGAAPTSDLELRLQQMEAIIREQSQRQVELEQALISTSSNSFWADDADDKGAEGKKTDLEKRLEKLEKAQAKEDEAAAKAKALVGKKPTMKIQGRIHADYWAFPDTSPGANAFETGDSTNSVDDRFLFRRLRLTFAGDIIDNMRYRLDVEFATPNDPTFKDAYLGWNKLPFFQTVLFGHQKRPYGLDHLNSSNNNIFLERPDVVEAFNQDARRFGLQSYGLSQNEAWNWRYGVFLPQDMQGTGIVTATPINEVYQTEFAGRLANTCWYDENSDGRGYAHWAIAGSFVHPDGNDPNVNVARFRTRPEARTSNRWEDTGPIAGAENYELLALEGVANWGPLQWVGEYQQTWVQRDAASEVSFHGGYMYLSYFLTGEHMVWDRESGTIGRVQPFENFFWVRTADGSCGRGWGAWQVALRYSHVDLTDRDIFGGVSDELTASLVWYWSAHARMLLNYSYGDIRQHAPVDGFTEGTFSIVGARFHVDF